MRKLGFWLVLKIKVKLCKNQDYSFSEDHDRTFLDIGRFSTFGVFFDYTHLLLLMTLFIFVVVFYNIREIFKNSMMLFDALGDTFTSFVAPPRFLIANLFFPHTFYF